MIELRHLRCFLGTVRERTISSAAEKLHISQPALSRTLQELEEDLGQQLIVRGKPLTLTAKGELLRRRAYDLLELYEHLKAEINSAEQELCGTITLAIGESPALEFLASCMQELQQRWPKVSFSLKSGNEDDVAAALNAGLADFGILIASARAHEYEHLILPWADHWQIIVPEESPLSQLKSISAADLSNQPVICSAQSLQNNEFAGWLGAVKDKINLRGTYNLPYNAYIFARHSRVCMLSLEGLVRTQPGDGMKTLPLTPPLSAQLHLVWRTSVYTSPLCCAYLNMLRMRLDKLQEQKRQD